MSFKKITPYDISDNVFTSIGKNWMLITAGNKTTSNCMTASWGGFGVLWNKPVVYIFVRPHRFTNEFIDKEDYFTINFFEDSYKNVLTICGKQSGRDINKAAYCGLQEFETTHKSIGYKNARMIIECKKIYAQQLSENYFIDISNLTHYPSKDYHIMYVGEITECYLKE